MESKLEFDEGILSYSKEEFMNKMSFEYQKIGANIDLINRYLLLQGYDSNYIAEKLSSYILSLSLKLSNSEIDEINKLLNLENTPIKIDRKCSMSDYEVVNYLTKSFTLYRLYFIIEILKAKKEHAKVIKEKFL